MIEMTIVDGTTPRTLVAHVLLASVSRVRYAETEYTFDGATPSSVDRLARRESIVSPAQRN